MSLYYKSNQIQQLRGFYYTAKLKSVTLASKFMNLTQPTISLQIKSLEERLETKLFFRHENQMLLTTEGAKLIEKAEKIIFAVDDIYQTENSNKDTKILNIAANYGSLTYILPNIIKEFYKLYPGTKIKIHYATKNKGVNMLSKGEADIFFTPKIIDVPGHHQYINLNNYQINLITHQNHPLAKLKKITLYDIGRHNIAMPPDDLLTIPDFRNIFSLHNSQVSCNLEFTNWEIAKKYVEVGIVASIVSDLVLDEEDKLFIYPLSEYFLDVSYGLMTLKEANTDEIITNFIDISK